MGGTTGTGGEIRARYFETDTERVLVFERIGRVEARATIAQNRDGYAMLKVRSAPEGDELERYYGLDMALDHVAERLGVPTDTLPLPDDARDMGM